MLRSLCILLLTIISWTHHIDCADNTDVARATGHHDGGFARNWRVEGPNTVLKWQKKFNPHKQFFYLTYDPSNEYCEITQVSTESPESETLTCRYKFKSDEKDVKIYNLIVPNKAEKNDWIEFSYSNAKIRAKNGWYIAPMNFTKCREENLQKSKGNVAAAPTVETDDSEKDVKIMMGDVPPLPKITSANLTSEANNKKTTCQLNDDRTEITCTQLDTNGKKLLDGVKYDLPTHWKADWFRIHNLKSDGAIILVFSDCPDGKCGDLSDVRLSSKGDEYGRIVLHGLDLKCSEVEANLTFDIADIDEGLCYHMVCAENYYKRMSEVKIESELQYRRYCVYGERYNS